MILEKMELVYVSPCLADPEKIRLRAELSDDISDIMPYLNAVMKNSIYNHHAPNLTLSREFRLITLYPRELTMIKALNTTDAWQVMDWLQELINETYLRQEEIEPDYRRKQRPHPLQIYAWLPRSNCRQCGERTCLAFAALLFLGEQRLDHCQPLHTEDFQEQREIIMQLSQALGVPQGRP